MDQQGGEHDGEQDMVGDAGGEESGIQCAKGRDEQQQGEGKGADIQAPLRPSFRASPQQHRDPGKQQRIEVPAG